MGLFFYDIFWVFCTPVMVSVAKNFDAPIKLLFPRSALKAGVPANFAMLGLGDIVIPGLFVALLLRWVAWSRDRVVSPVQCAPGWDALHADCGVCGSRTLMRPSSCCSQGQP